MARPAKRNAEATSRCLCLFQASVPNLVRFSFSRAGLAVNPDAPGGPIIVHRDVVMAGIGVPEPSKFHNPFLSPDGESAPRARRRRERVRVSVPLPSGFAITIAAFAAMAMGRSHCGARNISKRMEKRKHKESNNKRAVKAKSAIRSLCLLAEELSGDDISETI